jgi:hypothetical protein
MKKASKTSGVTRDDMRSDYRFNYRQARPNRFAPLFAKGAVAVVLEPDVASVFGTSEAVNTLLRSVIAALPAKARNAGSKRRKKAS